VNGSDDELASLNARTMRKGVHRNRCRDGQLQGTAGLLPLFEMLRKSDSRLTLMIFGNPGGFQGN